MGIRCGKMTTAGTPCRKVVSEPGAPCGVDHPESRQPSSESRADTLDNDVYYSVPSAPAWTREVHVPESFETNADLADWLNEIDSSIDGEDKWVDPIEGMGQRQQVVALAFDRRVPDPSSAVAYFMVSDMRNKDRMSADRAIPFDGGRVWVIEAPFGTSRRSAPRSTLPQLVDMLKTGSPVHITDRSGPGTKGTRTVEAVDANHITMAVR